MKLPVALALVIGVVGAIITYLYVGPLGSLGLMVPATFLGAASYFAAGGDKAALAKSVPTNVWGIVCGTITLVLRGYATNPLLVGVIVGGLTAVFILGALIPALGFVPGSVLGFATTVIFGLLTSASGWRTAPPGIPLDLHRSKHRRRPAWRPGAGDTRSRRSADHKAGRRDRPLSILSDSSASTRCRTARGQAGKSTIAPNSGSSFVRGCGVGSRPCRKFPLR
jgi:hypothetical protein